MVQIMTVCTVFLCCFLGKLRDQGFEFVLIGDREKPDAGEVDIDGDVLFTVDLFRSMDLNAADK